MLTLHVKPAYPELLLYAGFLFLVLIQEFFTLYLIDNPGYFFLLYPLLLLFIVFTLYDVMFHAVFPWFFAACYLFYKVYLFPYIAFFSWYRAMPLLPIPGITGAGIKVFAEGGMLPFIMEMFILLLDLLLFIILVIKYKPAPPLFFTEKKRQFILLIPGLCFLLFQTFFVMAEQSPGLPGLKQKIAVYTAPDFPAAGRMISSPTTTQAETTGQADPTDEPPAHRSAEAQSAPDTQSGFTERHWPAVPGNKYWNFVCLQVESLQCGLEHVQHNGQYVMPYLHSLVKTALYYPYCFSYHYSIGGTSDCEFSVLNNAEPTDNACMVVKAYRHSNSFIKVLKRCHYQPVAFHNYYKRFFDRVSAFPRIGFNTYYDVFDMKISEPVWVNEDREMFEFIINNRSEWKPPFLHYILTLSSHMGFSHIHRYHKAPFLADIVNKRDRDAYTCFNYVDIQLEKFITSIRQLYPDTWIFIYGDHSLSTVKFAGLLERSAVTVRENFLEFVPLFILAPDNRHGDFSGTLASFHDIGPTIISLLPGVEGKAPAYTAYGGSLLYDKVEMLRIPYNGTMYDRRILLYVIKSRMERYRQQQGKT